jgi:NAD(P)-dependent dehydrogenase (short-subunit alcohol dehydrogenase family)
MPPKTAMSKQMQGKICVITGGAGSIGAAAAKLLIHEGAKVMLVDLSETAPPLKSAAKRVSKISLGTRRTLPNPNKSRAAFQAL